MTSSIGTITVTDLECPCNWDKPERGRDFDFEGDWDALKLELKKDSMETGCTHYTVLDEDGTNI